MSTPSHHFQPLTVSTTPRVTDDIFEDIESSDNEDYLETLYRIVTDPDKFEKGINKRITELSDKLKREKNDKSVIDLEKQIAALKKEKEQYLYVVNKFIKETEFSKSPQEVDIRIEEINGQIFVLLGSPANDEDNPILFENYADFLKDWLKKFRSAQEQPQKKLLKSLKKNLKHNKLLKNLKLLEIDGNENNSQVIIDKIEKAIKQLEHRTKIICKKRIELIAGDDNTKKAVLYKKYKILTAMKKYAWVSKNNFDTRYNFSNTFYSIASLCSVCQNIANFARAIPGANLIADGVSKTFDFFSYFFLTTGQAVDPNVSKDRQLAAKRHFNAMKKYNIVETVLGGFGTLCLAIGLGATTFATIAIAPSLFSLGGLALTASNIIAAERYRKEIKWLSNKLKTDYPALIKDKEKILKLGDQNFNRLTQEQKAFYRDAKKIEAYQSSYRGKISDAIGTALATGLALTALVTLAFPPAGLALTGVVATTLTVIAAITTVYSLYKNYKTNKSYDRFKHAEKGIEKDRIEMILEFLNKLSWQPSKMVEKKEKQEEREIEAPISLYTPSFETEPAQGSERSKTMSPPALEDSDRNKPPPISR